MKDEIRPNFFETGSPFLKHPLLTDERTSAEIDFIVAHLALPDGARILDVGCGFGRHSIALARRGYAVVGIDPSAAMIAAARERDEDDLVAFAVISAEKFTTIEPFDAALCLFTTLGQITDERDNLEMLVSIGAALKPDGMVVVEVPQRKPAVAQLRSTDRVGNDERYAVIARTFDPETSIVTETFDIVAPEQSRTFVLRYRLFSFEELADALNESGFLVTAAFGDYAGESLTADHPTMILIGRK